MLVCFVSMVMPMDCLIDYDLLNYWYYLYGLIFHFRLLYSGCVTLKVIFITSKLAFKIYLSVSLHYHRNIHIINMLHSFYNYTIIVILYGVFYIIYNFECNSINANLSCMNQNQLIKVSNAIMSPLVLQDPFNYNHKCSDICILCFMPQPIIHILVCPIIYIIYYLCQLIFTSCSHFLVILTINQFVLLYYCIYRKTTHFTSIICFHLKHIVRLKIYISSKSSCIHFFSNYISYIHYEFSIILDYTCTLLHVHIHNSNCSSCTCTSTSVSDSYYNVYLINLLNYVHTIFSDSKYRYMYCYIYTFIFTCIIYLKLTHRGMEETWGWGIYFFYCSNLLFPP